MAGFGAGHFQLPGIGCERRRPGWRRQYCGCGRGHHAGRAGRTVLDVADRLVRHVDQSVRMRASAAVQATPRRGNVPRWPRLRDALRFGLAGIACDLQRAAIGYYRLWLQCGTELRFDNVDRIRFWPPCPDQRAGDDGDHGDHPVRWDSTPRAGLRNHCAGDGAGLPHARAGGSGAKHRADPRRALADRLVSLWFGAGGRRWRRRRDRARRSARLVLQ